MKHAGNAAEHAQGMALVVRIFEQADDGSGGPDELSKLPLTQAGFGAQLIDFSGYLVFGTGFLQGSDPVRPAFIITAMKDFYRVRGGFPLLGHGHVSSCMWRAGAFANACLRVMARSVSTG